MHNTAKPLVLSLVLLSLPSSPSAAAPGAGLLLVAHGAPGKSWTQPILHLATRVDSVLKERGERPFCRVAVAFLEFAKPTVAEAVSALEREGADSVFVLPIFIAPSGHTLRDLPNVLGQSADPDVLQQLADESTPIVRTRAHVTVGPTLAYGDFLERALVRQAKRISTRPDSEAVVILAHGDSDFAPIWRKLLIRLGAAVCGRTGISWFNFATVETGQAFLENGLPVIRQALEARPRVLVLGLYVNLPAEKIAKRHQDQLRTLLSNFRGRRVLFSSAAIVNDPDLPAWLAGLATSIRRARR